MCGIIYVKRKDGKPAYKSVLKRYRNQKSRGSDGFGYVAIKDGKVVAWNRAAYEKEIVEMIEKETAEEILFHHRFPTSTPNIAEAAHPILIDNQGNLSHQYFVAHNGVISNDDDLKKKHNEMGFTYQTEVKKFLQTILNKVYPMESVWNDSESLAIETALCLDGKKDRIETKGAAAVIGIKTNGIDVVERFFYRNERNPLKYHEDNNLISITSEGHGEAVKSTYIYRLKNEGGYEQNPRNIMTPWATSYTGGTGYQGSGGYHGGQEWKDWRDRKDDDEEAPVNVPHRQLPMPHSHHEAPPMGFLENGEVEDAEVNFSREIQEPTLTAKHISEVMKPYSEAIIKLMTDAVLWSELDRTVGAKKEMELAIEIFDNRVEGMDQIDPGIFNDRAEMQETLENIEGYEEALEKEITERDGAVSDVTKDLFKGKTGEEEKIPF